MVQSMSRPGGHITGFASAEFGMSAKWLEMLKEVAPGVKRVAVIQDPGNPGSVPQFGAIQSVAPSFGVSLDTIFLRDERDFETAVERFAREPNGGLIVTRTTGAISHRELIVKLAARHRLPAVYPLRLFVSAGGLVSYGPDVVDQFRLAAGYVDRILKGEKPADLPVHAPDKYELVINLKTVKALGLDVPLILQQRANEVIE
jgi:putative tryptophan/tyrosine transport system substrate-binding protein